MRTFLIIVMVVSGIIFIGSVLLMSPKGGLGMGIGGISGSNEFGSKKAMEGKLKQVAVASGLVFAIVSLILPYMK
ncbi:preprotein translocase subunit SecG [Candidatus Gracilibacteria bacterium]|nr:preprotein translocase subunit SecG [Candidatus Gracilibacteria bacterium]